MPACASGSAATPPAAPIPTMTTSVSFNLVGIVHLMAVVVSVPNRRLVEGLVVVCRTVVGLQLVRFQRALIGRGHHGTHAGIAEEIPADEVRIAAVIGIAEHPLARVPEQH